MLTAGFLTLAELKAELLPVAGISGAAMQARTDWDDAVAALGIRVAHDLQRHCLRSLERLTGHVYRCACRARSVVYVNLYPLESVASVVFTPQTGTAETLTDSVEFIDLESGVIDLGAVYDSGQIAVTCTGGYWLDDGDAQPSGSVALPSEIVHAFTLQAQAVAERTNLFGAKAARKRGEVREAGIGETGIIEPVAEILNPYRRMANG